MQHYHQDYDDQSKLTERKNGKILAFVWPIDFIQEYFDLFGCLLSNFHWLLLHLYFACIKLHFHWLSLHFNALWKYMAIFLLVIITFVFAVEALKCISIGYHYIWMYFGSIWSHCQWSLLHLNVFWINWFTILLVIITLKCILQELNCIFVGYHYISMHFGNIWLHFYWLQLHLNVFWMHLIAFPLIWLHLDTQLKRTGQKLSRSGGRPSPSQTKHTLQ